MRALLVERLPQRFAAARVASGLLGPGRGAAVGPLRLVEAEPPPLPGPGWQRVRPVLAGICGSDLATLDGASSRWFEPIVSFPFVPGHEIVGVCETGPLEGRRVVVEPVLGCLARGIRPPCPACAAGRKGACERITFGHLRPGLQTGYCHDTGGGWSESLVCHDSQLHPVADELADESAVMIEPAACGVHAALRARIAPGERVAVLGSGTLGLCVIAALRHLVLASGLVAVAKHPVQRRLAADLGADVVVEPDELTRAVRRATGSLAITRSGATWRGGGAIERLTGGADVVIDCVGSASSITEALGVLRPGGRLVLAGMPGQLRLDLTPLWQREIELIGAYAYGVEERPAGPRSTFDLAAELTAAAGLSRLVSARYPLSRHEEAVRHAGEAGRRGAVKVVFDLRREHGSWRQGPAGGGAARGGAAAGVAGEGTAG